MLLAAQKKCAIKNSQASAGIAVAMIDDRKEPNGAYAKPDCDVTAIFDNRCLGATSILQRWSACSMPFALIVSSFSAESVSVLGFLSC